MTLTKRTVLAGAFAGLLSLAAGPASAQDQLKLAVGQRGPPIGGCGQC